MKKLSLLLITYLSSFIAFSQSISIDPNSLQLPRLAVSPTCVVADKGKMIYNTSQEKVLYCNGTTWIDPATGGVPNNWVNSGNNSYLSNLGGSVGIGTSSPSYKLDILHNGLIGVRVKSSSDYSEINIDAATQGILRFSNNGVSKWTLNSSESNDFQIFQSGFGSRLFIESTNGNIGIGTTTPTQKLQVAGSAVVDGNLTVNNGMGIVRSDDATQMIIEDYETPPSINFTMGAGSALGPLTITFGTTFTTSPSISFGDTNGMTNPQNLVFTIESVTTTGAIIWIRNIGTTTSVGTNSSFKAMIIGKK